MKGNWFEMKREISATRMPSASSPEMYTSPLGMSQNSRRALTISSAVAWSRLTSMLNVCALSLFRARLM